MDVLYFIILPFKIKISMQLTKSAQIVMALFIITGVGYVGAINSAEAIVQKDGIRMAFCTNMAWTFAECNEQYDGFTWTDRFTVLVGASGFNEDSSKIDVIGGGDDDPIHVYSQYSRLSAGDVVFHETGIDTGIFMGNIKMTGQSHDADGDGGNDMMRMTKGNVFCEEDKPSGGMAMFIFGLPFLSDFFSLTQFFLPSADAADYGGTAGGGGGNSSIEKTCTWKAMKTMTQEHLKIVSSYDYAAKVKTEKQSGAITVSFQYQEDPKVKTIAATAHHNWRLGEVNFDKESYYVGEPITFYLRDADLWTMHHGQPAEYDVIRVYSNTDAQGAKAPVQFTMNHDHGSKNQSPDSDAINEHKYHREGSYFHAPPTALTQVDSSNEWKVYMWWEPGGLFEVGQKYALNIMLHDSRTDIMQESVPYSMDISLNGELIDSQTNQFTQSGHIAQKFQIDDRGTVNIRIFDIGFGDGEVTFTFQASPNSGKLFDLEKDEAYEIAWANPRWEGYMHQHFVDYMPGKVYTYGDASKNAYAAKYARETLAVSAGDQVCVEYSDRTLPETLPNGQIGSDSNDEVYYVEKCVDIIPLQ